MMAKLDNFPPDYGVPGGKRVVPSVTRQGVRNSSLENKNSQQKLCWLAKYTEMIGYLWL